MKLDNEFRFRVVLLLWIVVVNLFLQIIHLDYAWVIFISNIMMFTMAGDIRKNIVDVEIGGFVGLICAATTVSIMGMLHSFTGQVISVMIPLTIVLILIILFNPVAPKVFNNCGFAYFTCALIAPENFMTNFGTVLLVYFIGSLTVNCVCVFLEHRMLRG